MVNNATFVAKLGNFCFECMTLYTFRLQVSK